MKINSTKGLIWNATSHNGSFTGEELTLIGTNLQIEDNLTVFQNYTDEINTNYQKNLFKKYHKQSQPSTQGSLFTTKVQLS